MPGTTPGGLLTPLDAEPVHDGSLRIRQGFESLDQEAIELEVHRTIALSVPHGVWTKVTWSGPVYDHRSDGLSLGTTGIGLHLGGRYYCEATCVWPNSTGRKGLGIGGTTGTAPALANHVTEEHIVGQSHVMKRSFTVTGTAGSVLTVFLYNGSTGTLTIAPNYLYMSVRRLRLGQKHA